MNKINSFPVSVYNSLHRQKEIFEPAAPPFIGMYVCGPTVYGEPHLGHARQALSFDLIFRYFKYLGYKVRYVRNITDVGHLEDELADAGEDKISKRARLEKLEPMEIAQHYTNAYHHYMDMLNSLPPSIEPTATGHMIDQIAGVKKIVENGFGYEVDGSVYFDLDKYAGEQPYGQLSGKVLDDLRVASRNTEGHHQKKGPHDFSLWKNATPTHIMRWASPWGQGFPGWHMECSVMSHRYLGEQIDIHGGGMDLKFPHHEAEIAQNYAAWGHHTVKYWMHNNMLTVDGQKMGKSLNNFITLKQMFSGDHHLLEQVYSPMTVRFFILQAHYRSEIDFSNRALQAAERGYRRLMNAYAAMKKLPSAAERPGGAADEELSKGIDLLIDQVHFELSDDFNSAKALAVIFELSSRLNDMQTGKLPLFKLSESVYTRLHTEFEGFITDVFGLVEEEEQSGEIVDNLIELFIRHRKEAKEAKNYALADSIRSELTELGIQLKDGKDGTSWSFA